MQFSKESFVVLWSPLQNAFQVETVADMLAANIELFSKMLEAEIKTFPEKAGGDFLPLYFADSYEAANEKKSALMEMRDAKVFGALAD